MDAAIFKVNFKYGFGEWSLKGLQPLVEFELNPIYIVLYLTRKLNRFWFYKLIRLCYSVHPPLTVLSNEAP